MDRGAWQAIVHEVAKSWPWLSYYLTDMEACSTQSSPCGIFKPRQHIKKQRHYFANKGLFRQSYGFSSYHVWMWELDYKEIWVPKNWCFWTMVLEKTLESPLDCKEIQPVSPKGNQSWIYIGRTDAEAESPILWLSDVKNIFIRKDPDAGKEWRQEEKGTTEDEMVGWHHWLDGHEFEQALGVGDGQGSLACYSPWGSRRVGREWSTELTNILDIKKKNCLAVLSLSCQIGDLWLRHVCVRMGAQSCPTLCNRMDRSSPCSSVCGIFQARILEWCAISSSRGSFWLRDEIWVSCISCIVGRFFTPWAVGEALIEAFELLVAAYGI